MYRFKDNPTRSQAYLDWVETLPCCACRAPADDAHHIINVDGGKMAGKPSDLQTIPLCRQHHEVLHHNVKQFEQVYGSQVIHWKRTLEQAEAAGIIVLDFTNVKKVLHDDGPAEF